VFLTIYQWRIKPGKEEQFIDTWTAMTVSLKTKIPELTACLGRTPQQSLLAMVRWPSQKAWESQDAKNIDIFLQNKLLECIEDVENVIPLEMIEEIK